MKRCFFVTVELPKGVSPDLAALEIKGKLSNSPCMKVLSVKFRSNKPLPTSLPQEWTDLHEQIPDEGNKP